ncbi:MAG: hypothetical protein WD646_15005 [Actinomycetota bacterium]
MNRPFNARVDSRGGPPPGERKISVTTNSFGRLQVRDDVLAVPPDVPSVDRRPDAAIEEMVRRGYAEQRERRRVAGRVCRVYRVSGDSSSTELVPVHRAGGDHTDVCIDATGLVLEEAAFADETLSSRRVAVSVDERPSVDEDLFDLDEPTLGVREGGGSLQEVDPGSRLPGGPFWDLRQAPDGFEKRGRFAVIPPQPGFDDPVQRNSIITLMTDVWTDGIDVLTVERGATQGGVKPFEDDPNARRVDLGELGSGELRYGLRTSEVRVRTTGGRFVRVAGTLSGARLIAVARALEPMPEGPLVELD